MYNITANREDLMMLRISLDLAIGEMKLANDRFTIISYDPEIERLQALLQAIDKSINEPLPF